MNVLVTAGNTQAPIDRVRCLTNIFTGRTGALIAQHAHLRGHHVRLLTSHPETVAALCTKPLTERWQVQPYQTFDDLRDLMQEALRQTPFDAVVHCAAVSDYLSAGVYAPAPDTWFHSGNGTWTAMQPLAPTLLDRTAGKVKSDEPELWLRLVRAPKLIDLVRTAWNFHGILVKFKLEVGVSDEQLLAIAERSRRHSDADLMAANTLEGAADWAYLGPFTGRYERLARGELPARLIDAVEHLYEERHG